MEASTTNQAVTARDTVQGTIAVTGATGRVGRHIVDVLKEGGRDVVAISRSQGVDVVTGEGLAGALEGVEVVIDAATGPSPDQTEATEFFTTSARNLHEAGEKAGVRRIVVVSIVGSDKFTAGYQAAKLAHEQVHQAGPIPVRILRATQFHEFVEQLAEWGNRGETIEVWPMRTQLVAARSVAEALVDLAVAPDSESSDASIQEIGGPREERLVEMATLLGARRGDTRPVVGVTSPDDPDAAVFQTDALLPGPGAKLAGPTFEEWLDRQS